MSRFELQSFKKNFQKIFVPRTFFECVFSSVFSRKIWKLFWCSLELNCSWQKITLGVKKRKKNSLWEVVSLFALKLWPLFSQFILRPLDCPSGISLWINHLVSGRQLEGEPGHDQRIKCSYPLGSSAKCTLSLSLPVIACSSVNTCHGGGKKREELW